MHYLKIIMIKLQFFLHPTYEVKKSILSLIQWCLKCEIWIGNPSAPFIHAYLFSPPKFSHILLFSPCLIFINLWFIFINPCVLLIGVRHRPAIIAVSSIVTLFFFCCALNVYGLAIRMINMDCQYVFVLIFCHCIRRVVIYISLWLFFNCFCEFKS